MNLVDYELWARFVQSEEMNRRINALEITHLDKQIAHVEALAACSISLQQIDFTFLVQIS